MPARSQQASSSRIALAGLPDELAQFLSGDTYSLLIKGSSGTGKTILALTILKALAPIENPLYLSTRTSPLQLLENHPWIEEILGPVAPADGSEEGNEGWETLADARLDEPNVVFERVTNVLMDKQAPTVVIDSWESIGDTLGAEALRTNIKVLQTWRERAGARFVFIGDDPANTFIDNMMEGVVSLRDRVAEGRRLRQITLSKLHGVQIKRPSYFFTLEGGVFTSLPGYSPGDFGFQRALPVTFDRPFRRSRSRYPTGYSSLDAVLDGGLRAKSTAVIELGRRVDTRVGLIFLSRLVEDWLAAGDRVVMHRHRDVEPPFVKQFSKSFGNRKGSLVFAKDKFWKSQTKQKKDGMRTLEILSAGDPRWKVDGEEIPKADLVIVIGKEGEIDRETERKAAVLLKLLDIEGTLFLTSELPWSALFGVIPGRTAGNPMVRLEPVV